MSKHKEKNKVWLLLSTPKENWDKVVDFIETEGVMTLEVAQLMHKE